jgi:HEAT repeats
MTRIYPQAIARLAAPIGLMLMLTLTGCEDSRVTQFTEAKDIKGLIGILEAKNDSASYQAAEALGTLGNKQAVAPLIKALKAETALVRQSAAQALGKLQDTKALQPLLATLKDEKEEARVKTAAKDAIAAIAAKETKEIKNLITKLKGETSEPITEILSTIGKPAVDPLIAALKDVDPATRAQAAIALGNIGDEKAIKPLTANLDDWMTNESVGTALEQLKWEPTTDADKVHLLVAQRKGDELRSSWETTKKVLLADVTSDNYRGIQNALYAFISLGDKSIMDTLVTTLKEKGNKTMGLAYLNCGEETLDKAAKDWAEANGYEVVTTDKQDVESVTWGSW